ncbi:MAG: CHAT domain-containing protein [Bacteroidia bacterium]|nr:CHAT domain-containing protein [Bacteroidia bacterium]
MAVEYHALSYGSYYARDQVSFYHRRATIALHLHRPDSAMAHALTAQRLLLPGSPATLPDSTWYYAENKLSETFSTIASVYAYRYEQTKQPVWLDSAMQYYEAALQVEDLLMRVFSFESSQLSHLDYQHGLLADALEVAYTLYTLDRSPARLEQAFRLAERGKATLLVQQIRQLQARQGLDPAQRERLLHLRQALGDAEQAVFEARQAGEEALTDLQQEVLNAQDALDALQDSISAAYPGYAAARHGLVQTRIAEVQRMMGEDTYVAYFAGDTALFTFVIQRDRAWMLRTQAHTLKADVTSLLTLMKSDSVQILSGGKRSVYKDLYTTAANRLWETLLAPVAAELRGTLIISPDQAINYVPFAALLTGPVPAGADVAAWPYLIRERAVRYMYSATLWKELNSRPRSWGPARLLAVAPVYEAGAVSESERGPGDRAARPLATLPAARAEAQNLVRIWGGDSLAGPEATRDNFISSAGKYQVVHFAGHGLLHEANDKFHALAFTGSGTNPDTLQLDPHNLYLHDLYTLELDADLVVLSACETQLGSDYAGEGVQSLARGFFYAGARSLIATLWSVNDGSTQRLMEAFYTELATGKSRDEALRQAQLRLIADGGYPYTWAAHLLSGDARPIHPPRTAWYWMLAAGVLILFLAGSIWLPRVLKNRVDTRVPV